MADDAQHDFTDRAVRDLLARPDNFREFIRAAIPELADALDFERMRPAPREYFLGNWRRREADLLFEIPYRTAGREGLALVCVLVEHQSQADRQVPLKTFIYTALYWEWQWRMWEAAPPPRPRFALTPVVPIVLHTGSLPWGSARTLRDLLADPMEFHPFAPDWQPLFWELARHSAEELLDGPAAFLQALTILKADNVELPEAERLFGEVHRRIDSLHETGRVRWEHLLRFVLGWAFQKRPAAERPQWHTLAAMHTSADRHREIHDMVETIAQSLIQEGRQEGRLQNAQAVLIRLGGKRLGMPDEAVRQEIERIVDGDRLDRITDRINEASSWVDLLGTP